MRSRQPLNPTRERSSAAHGLLLFALAALCFVGAHVLGERARSDRAQTAPPDTSLIPSSDTLEWLSLGYRTFVADLVWLRALQYTKLGREQPLLPHFMNVILDLDPDFKAAYRYAGTTLIFAGGEKGITRENVAASNAFLERGMARYPDEAFYPYTLGLNWAFYMPSSSHEESAEQLRIAVHYLQIAIQKPDAPRDTALLIAGLMKHHEDPSSIVDFLEQAYVSEPDPDVRRQIELRLDALAGDRRALIEAQRKRLLDWHAANFDYLPPGLAYHVGERLFAPRE